MTSPKRNSFTSLLLNFIYFIAYTLHIPVDRTSNTVLTRNRESELLCLVPDLDWQLFSKMGIIGASPKNVITNIILNSDRLEFYHEWVLNFVNCIY